MRPRCELCSFKVYHSTEVKVHLVNNEKTMYSFRECFKSFNCEGANKCSNRDLKDFDDNVLNDRYASEGPRMHLSAPKISKFSRECPQTLLVPR